MKRITVILILFASILVGCNQDAENQSSNTSISNADVNYDSIRIELENIHDLDQGYREKVSQMKKFDGELVKKMNDTDSLNHQRVVEILQNHGWIPKSKIGDKASEAIFLVLQHGDVETMEKYLEALKKLAAINEASNTNAALMEDRILMYRGKKQVYGTQATMRQKENGTSEYYIWAIENPQQVNQRRQEMGFKLTVEENADRLNAIYNPKEKLPKE